MRTTKKNLYDNFIVKNIAWQRAGESPAHFKSSWVFAALSGYLFKIFKIMRTPKKKTESLSHPDVRSLKIQPKTRFNKYSQKNVPEIKLCGEWLQNLGFIIDSRVTITSMPGLLIVHTTK